MKPTLLYIHGLGSDRNSRKFTNLKDYFQTQFGYDFVEWNNDSDVKKLIEEKLKKYKKQTQLIIIGDSTGANFAYQLRELRNSENDVLILTSPLLDIDKRIANFDFPSFIKPQLIKIESPKNALIIASRNDEVLDQTDLFGDICDENFVSPHENLEVVEIDDSHRLLHFAEWAIPVISDYIREKIKEQ